MSKFVSVRVPKGDDDTICVRRLLDDVSVDAIVYTEMSFLHIAVDQNDLNLVKYLISKKINPNTVDQIGRTPLHLSIQKGYTPIALYLLSQKTIVDRNIPDLYGTTPLCTALMRGDVDLAKEILNSDEKNKEYSSALRIASQYGRLDIVQIILNKYALVKSEHAPFKTPLMLALSEGHLDIALLLVKAGANIFDCEDVLPVSARENKLDVVKFMLSHGADVFACDSYGNTAADYANDRGDKALIGMIKTFKKLQSTSKRQRS